MLIIHTLKVFLGAAPTTSIHTSTQGSKISLHKAALLAALTMTNDVNFTAEEFGTTIGTAANQRHVNNSTNDKAIAGQIISFAAEDSTQVWDLDAVSMGFFQRHWRIYPF